MVGSWVFRTARSFATILSVVLGLAVCVGTAVILVLATITLAANVVFILVFGVAYVFMGETGLAQVHAFLNAYTGR